MKIMDYCKKDFKKSIIVMVFNAKEVISLCRNISKKDETKCKQKQETCKQYYLHNKEILQGMTRAQYKNLSQEEQNKKKRKT